MLADHVTYFDTRIQECGLAITTWTHPDGTTPSPPDPRNFVNRCMRKRDERQNRADPKFWRAIPYIKNVSEAVSRLLAPLGVGVAHRPEATMRRQVMRPKDHCHGKKHLESFTGSGAVADKATTLEKLKDCSGRESPST
ncbi:hypothetical protein SprV_0702338800 [Sparganum proliferum]